MMRERSRHWTKTMAWRRSEWRSKHLHLLICAYDLLFAEFRIGRVDKLRFAGLAGDSHLVRKSLRITEMPLRQFRQDMLLQDFFIQLHHQPIKRCRLLWAGMMSNRRPHQH